MDYEKLLEAIAKLRNQTPKVVQLYQFIENMKKQTLKKKSLKPVMTHRDVMEIEKITDSTLIRRIQTGELIAFKFGATYLIGREDYLNYVNEFKNGLL